MKTSFLSKAWARRFNEPRTAPAPKKSSISGWPSRGGVQAALFILGTVLLVDGLSHGAFAAENAAYQKYDDQRIVEALSSIFAYIEGSFGALLMACAGVGAIISSAFGQYRACLSLMTIALASFTLRSFTHTFFNMQGVAEMAGGGSGGGGAGSAGRGGSGGGFGGGGGGFGGRGGGFGGGNCITCGLGTRSGFSGLNLGGGGAGRFNIGFNSTNRTPSGSNFFGLSAGSNGFRLSQGSTFRNPSGVNGGYNITFLGR